MLAPACGKQEIRSNNPEMMTSQETVLSTYRCGKRRNPTMLDLQIMHMFAFCARQTAATHGNNSVHPSKLEKNCATIACDKWTHAGMAALNWKVPSLVDGRSIMSIGLDATYIF